MRPAAHPADGFGRTAGAGMAAGRGAMLLAVAVALGVILLNAADEPTAVSVRTPSGSGGAATTETTRRAGSSATTQALRAPRDIKVLAANSTRTRGAAGRITDSLRNLGYNVLAPTDAPQAKASIVYFTNGFEREAVEIARILGLPPASVAALPLPSPVPDLRDANVLVIVGPDLAGPEPPTTTARAAARSTTTTPKTTTSTARATTTTARPTTTTTRPPTTTTTTTRPPTTTSTTTIP